MTNMYEYNFVLSLRAMYQLWNTRLDTIWILAALSTKQWINYLTLSPTWLDKSILIL